MLIRWIKSAVRARGLYITRKLPRGVDPLHDIRRDLPGKRFETLFDVGANIGQSAIQFRAAFPDARIWCFEPGATAFAALAAGLRGKAGVALENIGLGDEAACRTLNQTSDPTMTHIAGDAELPASVGIVGHEDVRLETLDRYCSAHGIGHIDYLKIDTEGYDLKVLKGAAGLLAANAIDFVMCECGMDPDNRFHCRFETIKAYLEGAGYRLYGIYEQWPNRLGGTKTLRRVNALFVSKAAATP